MPSKKPIQEQQKDDPQISAEAIQQALAQDQSGGAEASIIREISRLQLENTHLKKRNLRIWSANLALSIGLALVAGGALYVFPKYRYIATTDNLAICHVTTDSTPRFSVADVTNFAKDAVLDAYSYDYVNYRKSINEAMDKWFTENGRRAYMAGLESSGNLKRVISQRLILRSMAANTPQLEEISPAEGLTQRWTVVMPITIEFFEGGAEKPLSSQNFRASITVVRVAASAANKKGIGIESAVLLPPRN